MHPTRAASPGEWERALDQAVHNGLNMITLYVFWSSHQPWVHYALDWSLPHSKVLRQYQQEDSGHDQSQPQHHPQWELADAIQSCADRGLFVHLRLGPYTCAEYSYGGIPEWIGVEYPDIHMRRMDPTWLRLMEMYVHNTTNYMTQHKLWAHQGGPIILAQIENELGVDNNNGFMQEPQEQQELVSDMKKVAMDEVQEYADWCGELVQRVAPQAIVWTMCNGVSANTTIDTYNGDSQAVQWLANHGDNDRIQLDQPALWTEDEQGYQVWGETPDHPMDYFWGISARDVSKNVVRWMARGALHVNYYMWWGGYNRQRTAAAGIMNAYATDAILCPSGERRQPKFGHLTALHRVIASIAPLMAASQESSSPEAVEILNERDGTWNVGSDQFAFTYVATTPGDNVEEVMFWENNGPETVVARAVSGKPTLSRTVATEDDTSIVQTLILKPYSALILVNRNIAFDSATIGPEASAFSRKTRTDEGDLGTTLLDWKAWREPVVSFLSSPECRHERSNHPVEQTALFHKSSNDSVWSDYAWYSSTFKLETKPMSQAKLVVETTMSIGLIVYLDGEYHGSAENHRHGEGNITLEISLGNLSVGRMYELTILSESLGYHNLIGRWGGGVAPKTKGLIGDVTLVSYDDQKHSLVDGVNSSLWCSYGGLLGERLGLSGKERDEDTESVWDKVIQWSSVSTNVGPLWRKTFFDTPLLGEHQYLYVELTVGRGHVWLNGHDLGRFWNITRSDRNNDNNARVDDENRHPTYSQQYYHLPLDLLTTEGILNELVIVNVLAGEDPTTFEHSDDARLVLSWIEPLPHNGKHFEDTVGFADSCLI